MVFETCAFLCVMIDAPAAAMACRGSYPPLRRRRRVTASARRGSPKLCIEALLHAEPSFFVMCRYGLSVILRALFEHCGRLVCIYLASNNLLLVQSTVEEPDVKETWRQPLELLPTTASTKQLVKRFSC
jgi:hypothetical protein